MAKKQKINFKKAFTLIELLIVIAIIGVLSGIVLVNMGSAREKAKRAKALTTMRSISNIASMCIAGGGSLVIPAHSGNGGSAICSTGTETLPNISDTGFVYCGGTCGGWTSGAGSYYAFSAYYGSYAIVCGSDYNANNWYFSGSSFNFTGTAGCKTSGF